MGDIAFYGPSGINFYTETKVGSLSWAQRWDRLNDFADDHEPLAPGGRNGLARDDGHADTSMSLWTA
jgi:hypothetical protein